MKFFLGKLYDALTIEFNERVSERVGSEIKKFTKEQIRKRKNNLNEKKLRSKHKKKKRNEENQKKSQPINQDVSSVQGANDLVRTSLKNMSSLDTY